MRRWRCLKTQVAKQGNKMVSYHLITLLSYYPITLLSYYLINLAALNYRFNKLATY